VNLEDELSLVQLAKETTIDLSWDDKKALRVLFITLLI
jgi:hypothetical protein